MIKVERRGRRRAGDRSTVLGCGGAVASSQPLASQAGLQVLRAGGNAIDAALATAVTQAVVEPMSTGPGGDLFALVYRAADKKVYGLNASGRAPAGAGLDLFQSRGLHKIPMTGALAITVPGAVDGWFALHQKFGSLGIGAIFEQAIQYARFGFPVSEVIAAAWKKKTAILRANDSASRHYLKNGSRSPLPGELMELPALCDTLRAIRDKGPEEFYKGAIADEIVKAVREAGGVMEKSDLAAHTHEWVTPLSITYRGVKVYELPLNTPGICVLEGLWLLKHALKKAPYHSADHIETLINVFNCVTGHREKFLGARTPETQRAEQFLTSKKILNNFLMMNSARQLSLSNFPAVARRSDTVYIAAADGEGNVCSLINSLFHNFGSGVCAGDTGMMLQNRGACFNLRAGHPNCIEGGKRPMHTLIPGMAVKRGRFVLGFGVMGGYFQPLGQMQALSNWLDYKMGLQEGLDAPRIGMERRKFFCEAGVSSDVIAQLRQTGYPVHGTSEFYGGGQAVLADFRTGVIAAASDGRKDGCALAF